MCVLFKNYSQRLQFVAYILFHLETVVIKYRHNVVSLLSFASIYLHTITFVVFLFNRIIGCCYFQVGTDTARLSSSNLGVMKYALRALPVCIFPFTLGFPAVSWKRNITCPKLNLYVWVCVPTHTLEISISSMLLSHYILPLYLKAEQI